MKSYSFFLENALNYKQNDVVTRFCRRFSFTKKEGHEIFIETKKWLCLCAISKQEKIDFKLQIDRETKILDLMWHEWLLFTKDYHTYCLNKFGFFIHHTPLSIKDKAILLKRWKANPELVQQEVDHQAKKQFAFICKYLGEATLLKWYEELPTKYNHRL